MVANWTLVKWVHAYFGVPAKTNVDAQPFVYPLWFMRDLMVLNVLAPVLKKLIDRFPRLILLALTAAMVFNIDTHIPVLGMYSLVFFSLGYYLVKYRIHLTDADRLDPVLLAGFYGISLALNCLLRDSPCQYLTSLLSICLGIIFFFRFATVIRDPVRKKRLLTLAGYSLPVYLFHEMTLTVFRKLLTHFLPTSVPFLVLEYFGIPAVIIALCIAVSWILRRFMPRLYALLTGGRTL